MGVLEVRVKDHREAIGDFATLQLRISTVRIRRKASFMFWRGGWQDLQPHRKAIDLTRYTGKDAAVIFRGDVASGAYEGIHVVLRKIVGTHTQDGNALVNNQVKPLSLSFAIRARAETVIVLDFTVLDLSDDQRKGYELHIRGYELYRDGNLVRKVPPE